MLEEEHPHGAGPLAGCQLRYLAGSGWLGAVGFAASAHRLECRDRWIGDDRRRARGDQGRRGQSGGRPGPTPSRSCPDRTVEGPSRMTRSLTIDYGDEVLLALGMTPDEFSKEARTLIAVKLCEMGRLSTGAAAELANLPKPLFLTKLAAYGVDTFDMSEDELQGDVASARRHL